MSAVGRIVAGAVWLAVALAPVASAATGDYCVGVEREGCTSADGSGPALAEPGRARIFLGSGTQDAPATDGGVPVEIAGAGVDETVLASVTLQSSGSQLSGVSVDGVLELAGRAERVEARGGVDLLAGGEGTVA